MSKPILREIKQLATQLWIHTVLEIFHRMGVKDLRIIEGIIEKVIDITTPKAEAREKTKNVSGKIYDYLKGRVPRQNFIERVNKNGFLYGTAVIFNYPIWLVLNDPAPSQRSINLYMQHLERSVYNCLFEKRKLHGPSPRKAFRHESQIYKIGRINSLDSLAALLLLMREAELKAEWKLYTTTKWEIHFLLSRLATFSSFIYTADKTSEYIWKHFTSRSPLPDQLKINETNNYPAYLRGPPSKLNIGKEMIINLEIIEYARTHNFFEYDENKELDYLCFTQRSLRWRQVYREI